MATYVQQFTSGSATASGDLAVAAAGITVTGGDIAINPTHLAYGFANFNASGQLGIQGNARSSAGYVDGTTRGMMLLGVATGGATATYGAGRMHGLMLDLNGNLRTVVSGSVTLSASTVTASVVEVVPGTASSDLGKAEQSAFASGHVGIMMLGVENSGLGVLTSAVNSYTPIAVDNTGAVLLSPNGAAILVVDAGDYAEDAPAINGDRGGFVLGVRNDSDATRTSNNSDYGAFSIDAAGRIKTTPYVTTAAAPAAVVVSTAATLLATANSSRRAIVITNNGGGVLYVGTTTAVATASSNMGWYVQPSGGAYTDGDGGIYSGNLYGIYSTASTTHNVVVSERT